MAAPKERLTARDAARYKVLRTEKDHLAMERVMEEAIAAGTIRPENTVR